MKLVKLMVNGRYTKVNNKHIWSIGYFAYDNSHKIYLLMKDEDIETAMKCGYTLLPIEKLRDTYEKSGCLKYIGYMNGTNYLVKQGARAVWSDVKAPKKDIDAVINEICELS